MKQDKQLRAARESLGMTQAQLAELLGITRSRLYHWERGASKAPAWLVPRLLRIVERVSRIVAPALTDLAERLEVHDHA